jgi:hypothetical protein
MNRVYLTTRNKPLPNIDAIALPFRLAVTGQGIARAVAVLPWGERMDLTETGDGGWAASGRVPADWPKGTSRITLVLLDGAHDRTEVSLDLDVR